MMAKAINNTQNNHFRSNEFYINALKSKDPRDIERIYRDHFPMIEKLIIKNGGLEMEARDLFQEGILIIYSKIQSGTLNLTCKFQTFLYRICRNLWLKSLRRNDRSVHIDDFSFIANEDQEEIERFQLLTHRKELLNKKLNLLKNDERKLMRLFFAGKKMKEIAQMMNYKSVNYTKKKKSLIKSKLVSLIQNDHLFLELSN